LPKNLYLEAAKAEDVQDLLQHIAWTETLRPALVRERDMFTKLLVGATLGRPVEIRTSAGVSELSKEQLAGKIYGIDYIFDYFEKVLTRGARAVAELRSQGIS
jgi:hypothetical protein